MKPTTHYSQSALNYAKAVLELAEESKLPLESVGQELSALREMVETNETFRLYLADPAISSVERGQVLKRVLSGKVSPVLLQVLGVLNDKGRLPLLREVANAYDELLDEKLGKVEVDMTVAQKLSPDQLEQARKRIGEALKRDAVVHAYVDENIIGGMVLRVGDQLIDASVKYQLQAMKEKLLAARAK
jgi:F-type H+-transporting ATPase subunit delta